MTDIAIVAAKRTVFGRSCGKAETQAKGRTNKSSQDKQTGGVGVVEIVDHEISKTLSSNLF